LVGSVNLCIFVSDLISWNVLGSRFQDDDFYEHSKFSSHM
jgi:hypothetical protein